MVETQLCLLSHFSRRSTPPILLRAAGFKALYVLVFLYSGGSSGDLHKKGYGITDRPNSLTWAIPGTAMTGTRKGRD